MMYSKTMRGFFVILFVALSHFVAKTQSLSIVVDKGIFDLPFSCYVRTDLVTQQNLSNYTLTGLLNYLGSHNTFLNSNYSIEINFYNSAQSLLGTLTFIYLDDYNNCHFVLGGNSLPIGQFYDEVIQNPNIPITYTISIWNRPCITTFAFVNQTICPNNSSLAREGVIRVTPSNIPVMYQRIDTNNNVIWSSGSYSTAPFKTTISGRYRAILSSGAVVYSPIPLVFTNLNTCLKSIAAPNGNLVTSPNPALSQLHIDYQMAEEGTLDISIVDISGKKVIQVGQQVKVPKGYYQTNIDINHLAKGLYFVRVFDGKETSIQKIVKTE